MINTVHVDIDSIKTARALTMNWEIGAVEEVVIFSICIVSSQRVQTNTVTLIWRYDFLDNGFIGGICTCENGKNYCAHVQTAIYVFNMIQLRLKNDAFEALKIKIRYRVKLMSSILVPISLLYL